MISRILFILHYIHIFILIFILERIYSKKLRCDNFKRMYVLLSVATILKIWKVNYSFYLDFKEGKFEILTCEKFRGLLGPAGASQEWTVIQSFTVRQLQLIVCMGQGKSLFHYFMIFERLQGLRPNCF